MTDNQIHTSESQLQQRCAELEKDNARLEDALQRIIQWADAYPLEVFPEPDWKDARIGLAQMGITLDAVSAANMRHVIKGVGKMARTALEQK